MGLWSEWLGTGNGQEETKSRVSRDPDDGSVRVERLTRDSPEAKTHSHDIQKTSTDGETKVVHTEDRTDKKGKK